jgi:hypothetical protein
MFLLSLSCCTACRCIIVTHRSVVQQEKSSIVFKFTAYFSLLYSDTQERLACEDNDNGVVALAGFLS